MYLLFKYTGSSENEMEGKCPKSGCCCCCCSLWFMTVSKSTVGSVCCAVSTANREPLYWDTAHTHTHTHIRTRRQIDTPGLWGWFRPQQTDHPLKMLRRCLRSVGLRLNRPQHEGGRGATASCGDIHRRDASSSGSTTSTVMGDSVRQKTIDDLGGPSFLTTLNWLFVKGYFQTSQQLQVSETCVCVFGLLWPVVHLCIKWLLTLSYLPFPALKVQFPQITGMVFSHLNLL